MHGNTLDPAGPVRDSERIVTLDILRGLALFGMILVHFHQKMESEGAVMPEDLIGWFVWMGVETKSWATFAILFGAGFAILMRRVEARGRRVVPVFLRRMLVLGVIGMMVFTLFGFQILLEYAIWGVALLFVRNWPTRALLILLLASAVASTAYGVARSAIAVSRSGPEKAAVETKARQKIAGEKWRQLQTVEADGSYAEVITARVSYMRWSYLRREALIPGSDLVLFIVGLLAIRHGIFDDPLRKRRVILVAMSIGLVSWAAAWWVLPKIPDDIAIGGVPVPFNRGLGMVSDQWLALTYVGAVTLMLAYWPVWKRRLSVFGIAGRMALTNYITQAAVISWLASGYGLGLQVRPYYVVLATLILFAMLAMLSRLWFSRFSYGPLEWIWRSLTYGEWRPIRANL